MVLVTVGLIPVALAGPERSQDPLFIQRISSSADLEVVGIHQSFERRNIEVQMSKEPFALRNEDLLDRIHRRNLISQGILPLRLKEESDYDSFEQGQTWELPEIRDRLESGDVEVPLKKEGDEVTLLAEYSRRERAILLAGGILRQLREKAEDEQPEASPRVSGEAER